MGECEGAHVVERGEFEGKGRRLLVGADSLVGCLFGKVDLLRVEGLGAVCSARRNTDHALIRLEPELSGEVDPFEARDQLLVVEVMRVWPA